jgi:hypothetical protein
MPTSENRAESHSDGLPESTRGIGQSLRRLVELGEAMLAVLAVHGTEIRNITRQTSATGSVGCSTRPENCTNEGVFDLSREDIISFAQAGEMIATHPSASTISRWCSIGCRGIKLESILIGGRRKTSRPAIERFLVACRERDWAGMHGGTAFHLERAMAEKNLRHDQQTSEQPSHDDHAPLTTQRADTRNAHRPKSRRNVPVRGNRSGRDLKRRKRGT